MGPNEIASEEAVKVIWEVIAATKNYVFINYIDLLATINAWIKSIEKIKSKNFQYP